jgi:hypothetical protein
MTDFGCQWYPEMDPLDLNWDEYDLCSDEDVSTSGGSPDPKEVATVADLSLSLPSDEDASTACSCPSGEQSSLGTGSPETSETPDLRRCGRNRIRKGEGRDSRTRRPDKGDNYRYESESPAFRCIREQLGYEGISLASLARVGDMISSEARTSGIEISYRSRAARRRKPCAFHWVDENWDSVEGIFRSAIREVLGDTTGVKKKGRKRKFMPELDLAFPPHL